MSELLYQQFLGRDGFKATVRVNNGTAYLELPNTVEEAMVIQSHPLEITVVEVAPSTFVLELRR